jgi:hypothetical protein
MANKFVAYYIDEKDRVVAAAGQGNTSAMLTIMEAIQQNAMPSGSMIKEGRETPESIQLKLKQNVGASRCKRANCCQKKAVM